MTPTENPRVAPDVVNTKKPRLSQLAASLLAFLVLLLACSTAFGSPDLIVAALEIEPGEPLPGATVQITATVENVGNSSTEGQFLVRFEIDGQLLETPAISSDLRPGRTKEVTVVWSAVEGAHTISAEVDQPFDRIAERDEDNNLTLREIRVRFPSEIAAALGGLRVAVGPFEDESGAGLVNVEEGVAEKIGVRLEQAGVRVVEAEELEDAMRQYGLNPFFAPDVGLAAEILGADALVTGSIAEITTSESSLSLGVVSVGGGSADVTLRGTLAGVPGTEPISDLLATAHYEGTTELSIDLGALFSAAISMDVCSGGVLVDRAAYYGGDPVSIGYTNPGAAGWFSAEIHTSTGTFVRWVGWRYVESGACGRWAWDQRDTFGQQVSPSIYVAKVWDGAAYVGSTTFQIQPGVSLFPMLDEVTVGSESFEDSIIGEALNRAVDKLVTELILALEAETAGGEGAPEAASFDASPLLGVASEGQVAAILPDGRVAITLGTASGIAHGDRFTVIDPETSWTRGEIVIVEIRDHVSYALRIGEFVPEVGDVVRPVEP